MPINHDEFDRLAFALRAAELQQRSPEAQQLRDKLDAVNDKITDRELVLPALDVTYEDAHEQGLWGVGEPIPLARSGDATLVRKQRITEGSIGWWPEIETSWILEIVDSDEFDSRGAESEFLSAYLYSPVSRAESMLPPVGIRSVRQDDLYHHLGGQIDWDPDLHPALESEIDALSAFMDSEDFELIQ